MSKKVARSPKSSGEAKAKSPRAHLATSKCVTRTRVCAATVEAKKPSERRALQEKIKAVSAAGRKGNGGKGNEVPAAILDEGKSAEHLKEIPGEFSSSVALECDSPGPSGCVEMTPWRKDRAAAGQEAAAVPGNSQGNPGGCWEKGQAAAGEVSPMCWSVIGESKMAGVCENLAEKALKRRSSDGANTEQVIPFPHIPSAANGPQGANIDFVRTDCSKLGPASPNETVFVSGAIMAAMRGMETLQCRKVELEAAILTEISEGEVRVQSIRRATLLNKELEDSGCKVLGEQVVTGGSDAHDSTGTHGRAPEPVKPNIWEKRRPFARQTQRNEYFEGQSMGFTHSDIYAFISVSEVEFDISFKLPQGLEGFWALYEQKEDSLEWQGFTVTPISRPETKVVTNDVLVWLQKQCPVLSPLQPVYNEEGFWVAGWRVQFRLQVQNNVPKHLPSPFFIGNKRGSCFYPGHPRQQHVGKEPIIEDQGKKRIGRAPEMGEQAVSEGGGLVFLEVEGDSQGVKGIQVKRFLDGLEEDFVKTPKAPKSSKKSKGATD
ncbi:hypothetical protein XELAEV_18037325mg [Xenopus laevis]|uniref:Uncharacterized protein n=1 Tax=Xenopus laevis TaxID=8355 RepID=A0A974CCD2_XENLA|nr:hypothetical protein XELAEV_18037325mg [Xenopus laevis]